ncbi:MAG: tyrosine-type recombinase/integrase [Acidobacteria bacterium]|nr:tyrosine-type recombinase/integrase [Acidobacteriota bacterium]
MSPLAQAAHEYLALRRALGYRLDAAGRYLLRFVTFLENQGATHITVPLALQWANATSSSRSTAWPALRLSMVRGFARYCHATDPRTEIPPVHLLPFRPARARPYIYSDEEINRLLLAADQLPSRSGLRPRTYRCLLSLLIVAGLRISEARRLCPDDIDWTEGVLTIRGTKFGKSRLVPLHTSSVTALADYGRHRDQFLAGRTATRFFISDRGTPLNSTVINQTFCRVSRQAGLRAPGAGHGPRLHDCRHRFALKTLAAWYRNDEDVEQHLPILSTYLGHVSVSDTYWYLTACPELLGEVTRRLERRWKEVL